MSTCIIIKQTRNICCIALILLISAFLRPAGAQEPQNLSASSPTKTQKIILDNGLTVLLKEIPGDIVSLVALIKSGSVKEGKFQGSGISHLTEHMLFKDHPEDPKSEIARQVSTLGGDISGSTSYDATDYSITLPKENALKALELLQRLLTRSRFRLIDLQKEKLVVAKEINLGKDNPAHILWDLLMQTAFTRHPYRYPIIGYEDLLRRITLNDLKEYYRQTYIPQNMILSIAGDFDANLMTKKIGELFGKSPRGPLNNTCDIIEPSQTSLRQIQHHLKTTVLAYVGLAFRSVNICDKDMYALDVLSFLLAGGNSARLPQQLKERLELVYAISASNYTPIDPGLFTISYSCEPKTNQLAFEAVLAEIEKIKKSGVSDEELKRAKQSMASNILFSQEHCENIAHSRAQYESALSNPDFEDEYLREIDKVTGLQIKEVAIKYLNTSSLTYVSVVPNPLYDKTNPLKQPPESKKPQIKKFDLDGGLKVLLLEDKRLPIVDIRMAFLGGLLAENNQNNGISSLASNLLLKGTSKKNEYEISRLVESWGGSLSSFSGNNSFGISLKAPKVSLNDCLKLIAEIITQAKFPLSEINKEKKIMLALLKKQKEDIFTIGNLLLKKELYQNHPYAMNELGTQSSITGLDRQKIMDFYRQHAIRSNTIISVFGDINSQETLKLIKKLFSKIPSLKTEVISRGGLEPLVKNISIYEILKKEQALFLLAFPTCSIYDNDRYGLDIISEVLSNIDGRLFKHIRSQLGIAYTLGAYNSEMLQAGNFVFYVATTAENLGKAKEKIWKEISQLKKSSITAEELSRAKNSLLGKRKISLESNGSLSWQASLDELYGLGFQNYQQYENRINSITRQEAKRILNKYCQDKFVEIFISPSLGPADKQPAQNSSFRTRLQNLLRQLWKLRRA